MQSFTNILSIVLAVGFLLSAAAKLVGVEAIEESARKLGISRRLHVIAALLEIAAAAGLVLGIWWLPLRIAAAIGLTIMMAIAVGYHMSAKDKAAGTAAPALLGAFTLVAAVLSVPMNL
ncbi:MULTISPECIES: DoxX family protein [unclassified Mycobacterium]|uniref:DoxX family protein n=1 Tax=unclassified Mycobacterium TaxID=2642494 RepID=UPI0029C75EDE|nr:MULTISPECIES: DoxX family protein [unclassified Mycobacterium]